MKPQKNTETIKVKTSNVKLGFIKHSTLSDDFIRRVNVFKKALAEIDNTSLENTLDNFKRDLHSETELEIWEHIAKIYQWTMIDHPDLTIQEKHEVFSLLLNLSMCYRDFNQIVILNKELVAEIVSRY